MLRETMLILFVLMMTPNLVDCSSEHLQIDGGDEPIQREHRSYDPSKGHKVKSITEYPYIASILKSKRVKCVGTLITNQFIMTAAYCFFYWGTDGKFTVRLGSTSANKRGKTAAIRWIYIHPMYLDVTKISDDIALIELVKPLRLTYKITPAVVSNYDEMVEEKASALVKQESRCTVIGFGAIHSPKKGDMYSIDVKIISWNDCKAAMKGRVTVVPEFYLCAMPEMPLGTSRFNVGSPLICRGKVYGTMAGSSGEFMGDSPFMFVRSDYTSQFRDLVTMCYAVKDKCTM